MKEGLLGGTLSVGSALDNRRLEPRTSLIGPDVHPTADGFPEASSVPPWVFR
jgi:hypothetical protein